MKAYYVVSSEFKKKNENDIYKKTANYLSFKLGAKNLFHDQKFVGLGDDVTPQEINKQVEFGNKAQKETDVLIADVTDVSAGVGYAIAMAISGKKPALVLLREDQKHKFSHNQITAGSKLITFKTYASIEEITKLVDRFLEEAKQKIDTKFILIIPPDIDRYLSWAGDYRRVHKAQIVRNAIEKEMKKDKDWRDYCKSDAS